MNLSFEKININLLHCSLFTSCNIPEYTRFHKRTLLNYEIEFFLESNGGLVINDTYIPFSKNEISFRKPHQVVCGTGHYQSYTVAFSFLEDNDNNESIQAAQDILNKNPDKITGQKAEQLSLYFQHLHHHYICNDFFLAKSAMYKIAHDLIFLQQQNISYNNYVKQAITYLNSNYQNEINFETVAHKIGISKPYFYDLFKQATGTTPNNYLTKIRIENAKKLLLLTDLPIKEIGYACGFNDNVYFSYLFRKEIGIPASEFRNQEKIFH